MFKMKKIFILFLSTFACLFLYFNCYSQANNFNYYIGTYHNNEIFLNDNTSFEINLSNYNLYHVENYYSYDFYIYDVLENSDDKLYEAKCITKYANYDYKIKNLNNQDLNEFNTLEILYRVNDNVSIVYVPLNEQDYNYVISTSQFIDFLSNSDLVERLKRSLASEFSMKSEFNTINNKEVLSTSAVLNEFENSNVYCNKNNTVRYGECQDYTNTNACIYNLKQNNEFFSGQFYDYKNYTDSAIVYAIPKKYFMTRGIFSYIGPEYGFYINTYQDTGNDNISNFLIFDIEATKKAYNQNGTICVKPLLTGYTKYKRDTQIVTYELDSSNLAITNINMTVSLFNQTEKNIGDEGYVAEEDYGYAFKAFTTEAKLSPQNDIKKKDMPNLILAKLFAIGVGYIPKAGPFLKLAVNTAIAFVEGYYESQAATQYQNLYKSGDGYFSTISNLNATDSVYSMINEYGNLLKSIVANLEAPDYDKTLMYKSQNNDYFKLTYAFFQHSSDVCWDTSILSNITLDVVEDDTKGATKSVRYMDTVTGSWVDSFNETPENREANIYLDTPQPVEYALKGYQILNFTPSTSGEYMFETYNTESDTCISLYQNDTLLKRDDDGGLYINSKNSKHCSRITQSLDANKKYSLKIYGFNDSAGYCNVIVKRKATEIIDSSNGNMTCSSNTYNSLPYWQEFSPITTSYYTFCINSNDCSVELSVYDSNHNRIATNYYASYNGKTLLYLYLKQNQKYYVRSKIYGYMGRNYTFGIYAYSSNLMFTPDDFFSEQFYMSENENMTIYSIVVPESSQYTLGVHLAQGYTYLNIDLYDDDFNKISSTYLHGSSYTDMNTQLVKNHIYIMVINKLPDIPDTFTNVLQANIFVQKGN